MIRCEEGHFYDPAKHSGCPWCAKPLDLSGTGKPSLAESKTRPLVAVDSAPATPPRPSSPSANAEHGVTRRLDAQPTGISPVVGWLVCVEGTEKGRDFRLHSEKNFVGRASSMDISIAGDDSISREKHAVVTFEPKKRTFWLLPGDASGLVYLNGEMVHSPTQINADDLIEIGQSKLVLVSLSSPQITW